MDLCLIMVHNSKRSSSSRQRRPLDSFDFNTISNESKGGSAENENH